MRRLFVAVGANETPFDPVLALKKLKVNLNEQRVEYRWVSPKNYHITVCFLGTVEEEKLPELKGILSEVAASFEPFTLKLSGVGAYPSERSGRVIWMGVQNSITLRNLQAASSEKLKSLGWKVEERDYSPHLTLARLRSPKSVADLISPVKNQEFGKLEVKELTLYESKLSGNFPVYEPLEKFLLGPPQ